MGTNVRDPLCTPVQQIGNQEGSLMPIHREGAILFRTSPPVFTLGQGSYLTHRFGATMSTIPRWSSIEAGTRSRREPGHSDLPARWLAHFESAGPPSGGAAGLIPRFLASVDEHLGERFGQTAEGVLAPGTGLAVP